MTDTPHEMVERYLRAAGERRFDEASRYLADEAVLTFPQGTFATLRDMALAMATRYQSISKVHETWDTMHDGGRVVVVTTGTLNGVNGHGVEFSDIRFCDRFVVQDGRIREQHVWNDLAESGVLDQKREP